MTVTADHLVLAAADGGGERAPSPARSSEGEHQSVVAAVEHGRESLARARSDFERLRVRDLAAAALAAAKVLQRKDVAANASWLMTEAEACLLEANPPRPPGGQVGNRNAASADRPEDGLEVHSENERGIATLVDEVALTAAQIRTLRSSYGGLDPDQIREIVAEHEAKGEPVVKQQIRKQARMAKAAALAAERAAKPKSTRSDVAVCDVSALGERLKSGSVDAIITNPPYVAEKVGVYETLAGVAARLLRPGGVLVAMAGHIWLPETLDRLRAGAAGTDLNYQWTLAELLPWSQQIVHSRKVVPRWKPAVIMARGRRDGERFVDLVQAKRLKPGETKQHHEWEQNIDVAEALVERFTDPGDFLVDPFCGSGTFGVAAIRAGRRWHGSDIDRAAVDTTIRRLSEEEARA